MHGIPALEQAVHGGRLFESSLADVVDTGNWHLSLRWRHRSQLTAARLRSESGTILRLRFVFAVTGLKTAASPIAGVDFGGMLEAIFSKRESI